MNTTTIKFDQTDTTDPDNARVVNATDVPASADGETVSFTLPNGAVWSCDQEALSALLGTAETTITLDRAKSIADAAVAAGLAEPPTSEHDAYTFSSVLRAKLADEGVERIAQLSTGQAERLEAFIESEKTALAVA
ncbi:MAG TPA: hypothetical protein VG816_13735 [Solirubrobacterales bacterium]|nr:hypothetical protein [Solirubrobacterales bacterium]